MHARASVGLIGREYGARAGGRPHGVAQALHDRAARRAVRVQGHSTNGTYVTVDSEKSVLLKGDDLALRRFGWIGFSDVRYAGSDVVQFSCG